MQIGVNYPWRDYGWDFGLGPPAWRGTLATPRWYGDIDGHLRHLHDLGLEVLRWFILADGLTYGTGDEAPVADPVSRHGWRFDPPPLGEDVLEHVEELLRRFTAFNGARSRPIRLLPVLIDFHFCGPGTMPVRTVDAAGPLSSVPDPGWVKQGRADAIADADKRRRFLDLALDPLLHVSRRHRDAIYAWELINEPEWITNGWHPDGRRAHPIDEPSMRAFLQDGKDRIRQAGFKPTIGFASFETLRTSRITAEINQFHHYPGGRLRLPRHAFDPEFPGIIGEFATSVADVWPDLPSGGPRVLDRLRLSARQGYPMAIPWSFLAHDRHSRWTDAVERDLAVFAAEHAGLRDPAEAPTDEPVP